MFEDGNEEEYEDEEADVNNDDNEEINQRCLCLICLESSMV